MANKKTRPRIAAPSYAIDRISELESSCQIWREQSVDLQGRLALRGDRIRVLAERLNARDDRIQKLESLIDRIRALVPEWRTVPGIDGPDGFVHNPAHECANDLSAALGEECEA